VFGICAGMQLLAEWAGAEVRPLAERGVRAERGFLTVEVLDDADLLAGLPATVTVFQDHEDEVADLPNGFRLLARSDAVPLQAFADDERRWWGTQFHPEWSDDTHRDGNRVLENFFALADG
jgi:GMP synthase (glutamine-hydrolysing)